MPDKMQLSNAMSMIEVVIAISLIGFLFTLSLNITDLSLSTTSSNKDRFIANQALQVESNKLYYKLKTNLIRYGKRQFLNCFLQENYPNEAECTAPEDGINIVGNADLRNADNFQEIDGLKVRSSLTKTDNSVKALVEVKFLEDGSEKLLTKEFLFNPES